MLEARDRLGGRVWTDRSLGTAVDLGASWIEGADGNPVAALAKEFGVKTVVDEEDWAFYDHHGQRIADATVAEVKKAAADLQEKLEQLAGKLDRDISIHDAVRKVLAGEDLTKAEQRFLQVFLAGLESDSGGEVEKLSLRYAADDDGFDGDSLLIPGGYDQIAQGLAKGLDVRLAHRVSKIEHGQEGVRVTTDKGRFAADGAVVTLPLGVLKQGSVEFVPALPKRKQAAIARLEMGRLDKIVLKFPRVFWPKETTNLGYVSTTKGEFPQLLNWYKFSGQPILIVFVAGSFGRKIEGLADREVEAQVMAVLRKLFGADIPGPTAIKISRWGKDPLAGGCYSYVPVGATSKDYDILAEPVGTLFFAGEATSRPYRATVHGAFLSGIREAKQIIKLLTSN